MATLEKMYEFVNPDTASLRIPLGTNENGEIASEGETVTGTKNFTFSYVKVDATANELIYGEVPIGLGSITGTSTGIVGAFITYLLGATPYYTGIKRTVIQNTSVMSSTPPV